MTGGVGGLPTYLYRWNSVQLFDDAFLNKGRHSIKFGGAFERMMLQVTALTDANGIWFFNDLQSFLTNSPNKFQGGVASSLTPRDLRQSIFGAYIQDDWRAKTNLTLNLGLRYEMSTVPTELNGKLANLRNLSLLGHGFLLLQPNLSQFRAAYRFCVGPHEDGKVGSSGRRWSVRRSSASLPIHTPDNTSGSILSIHVAKGRRPEPRGPLNVSKSGSCRHHREQTAINLR